MYCPLGVKTDYSLLSSLIKIDDYLSFGLKNNLTCLGILDNNLNSSHMFYKLCKKNNIKPIIGLDLIIDNYHIYLYPKNYAGLTNLFKLLHQDTITLSSLPNYSDNIIGVIPYASHDIYKEITKIYENTFISFSNKKEETSASLITTNIVYINNIYALDINSSKYINYLSMIDNNTHLGDVILKDYSSNVLSIEKYDTNILTDLINIEFPTGKTYIPKYESENDSKDYLRMLANKGLNKRLDGNISSNYQKRLDYELSIIESMGFVDYFLIVLDYVRYAIKEGIYVGAGRGSAVGSLVSYSLGITWIDPLKYNLIFERFLNPERVTMPDIDIDFDSERRDEVVNYVRDKYGKNRVAHIITYGTMASKEVLRSVAKINNVPNDKIDYLLPYIDSKLSLRDNLNDSVKDILKNNSDLQKVYNESYYLEKLKRNISTHAAGVVICSEDLDNILPIIKSGDYYLTGYDKDELEEMGLLKMDFLSIKNLTIITNTLRDIKKYTGKNINLNKIPLDDPEVFKLFSNGDTVGIFQFESRGMKNFLRELHPTVFSDLVMAIAIYRPGPMGNIETYIKRKNGKEPVTYLNDSLVDILSETYGIIIYQEQIMQILVTMGGFTFGEADVIRRAISKKKLSLIEATKEKFIVKSIDHGYSESDAKKIYELIVKFASYGFNKSHSVAYAFIAYQMAYLKVHFKDYYYINLLDNNIGGENKTKDYIDEAKKSGIQFLHPSINLSSYTYTEENNYIRLPLRCIKGVGNVIGDKLITVRGDIPFKDIYDLFTRTSTTKINKNIYDILIDASALDEFGFNHATLHKNLTTLMNYAELTRTLDSSLVAKPEIEIIEETEDKSLMNLERELFGFYISKHPAGKYPDKFKIINVENNFDKWIDTVVLIESIRSLKTKNGDDMAFISGSDETGTIDFVIFPKTYEQIQRINIYDLVSIHGHVERRLDKYQIIVSKIEKI